MTRGRGAVRRGPALTVLAVLVAAGLLATVSCVLAHPDARFYRGDIVASTSWEGVVRLTGTVTIREGVTVTVEPGTEVLVQPKVGADIVVRGRLLVRGVPSKPVLFDTAGGEEAGTWGGIVFGRGSTGILEHVRVRGAAAGISGELSGVTQRDVIRQGGR